MQLFVFLSTSKGLIDILGYLGLVMGFAFKCWTAPGLLRARAGVADF